MNTRPHSLSGLIFRCRESANDNKVLVSCSSISSDGVSTSIDFDFCTPPPFSCECDMRKFSLLMSCSEHDLNFRSRALCRAIFPLKIYTYTIVNNQRFIQKQIDHNLTTSRFNRLDTHVIMLFPQLILKEHRITVFVMLFYNGDRVIFYHLSK